MGFFTVSIWLYLLKIWLYLLKTWLYLLKIWLYPSYPFHCLLVSMSHFKTDYFQGLPNPTLALITYKARYGVSFKVTCLILRGLLYQLVIYIIYSIDLFMIDLWLIYWLTYHRALIDLAHPSMSLQISWHKETRI